MRAFCCSGLSLLCLLQSLAQIDDHILQALAAFRPHQALLQGLGPVLLADGHLTVSLRPFLKTAKIGLRVYMFTSAVPSSFSKSTRFDWPVALSGTVTSTTTTGNFPNL